KKFYPFVDRFGQLKNGEWPDKIHNEADLLDHLEKEKADLATHAGPPAWNKYGGWETGPRLGATGRFRVEKYQGKWWFVDPEGKLFWSNGFDCVELGRQSQTRITGREGYFDYLPSYGSAEAQLYYITGEGEDTIKHLSFHALNLYRKFGDQWKTISNENIHQRMLSWGFNTIGNWSDREIYLKRKTPYVLTAYTKKTGEISDPYLPGYRDDLQKTLALSSEELNDPWCIGVFIDNELKWGVKWASKIGAQILTAPPSQPAKRAFQKMLTGKYSSIEKLNQSWKVNFDSWDQFMTNQEYIPGATDDIKQFMDLFATKYYSTCRDAVRNIAPDLLYLGCRMDFHLYPEDTSLNTIIEIAAKYCDVVSFNRYRYSCSELTPPSAGDYPIIIGEYHFGSLETGLLQPGLRYAADQNERAELFGYYLTSALKNPYIVGAHWFQLVDQSVAGRGDGENYQAGFLTVGDVPQHEMITRSREIGAHMYDIRMNDK
ncbi:MAG TPA: beta-galactosidase, partial [Bacteroidales bacterium]|nr:beta-galactosidase [Bacteroidales bacterium]